MSTSMPLFDCYLVLNFCPSPAPPIGLFCASFLSIGLSSFGKCVSQFLGRLVRNLSDAIEMLYVCNNASWAIGEIANAVEKEVRYSFVYLFVCSFCVFPSFRVALDMLKSGFVQKWVCVCVPHVYRRKCTTVNSTPVLRCWPDSTVR